MDNFFNWSREVINIGSRDMKLFYEDNKLKLEEIFSNDSSQVFSNSKTEFDGERFSNLMLDIGRLYFSNKIIDRIVNTGYDQGLIDEIKHKIKSSRAAYITYDSKEYPDLLRNVYDPPYLLYYYGDISLVNKYPLLSVVGARKCTDYGKNATKYLLKDLCMDGIVIVSGLASGIDSYAHIYCMENNMPTIAVMGTAIDEIYPKSNSKLFREILDKGGLIIAETGPGGKTFRSSFAMRNRIIAGLSRGILVVEAGRKSGSLITATYGVDNGREVYLVPGSIFSDLSYGCNEMIGKGGKIVLSSRDILEDYEDFYGLDYFNNKKINENTGNGGYICDNIEVDKLRGDEFSDYEKDILKLLLEKGPLEIDKISLYLKLEIGEVIFYVNNLTMQDYIFEVGINTYQANKVLIL